MSILQVYIYILRYSREVTMIDVHTRVLWHGDEIQNKYPKNTSSTHALTMLNSSVILLTYTTYYLAMLVYPNTML